MLSSKKKNNFFFISSPQFSPAFQR
jgi:hypothetical protein